MRLTKIVIQNYKSIENQEINLDGKSFFLIGGNGVGKTSAGAALIDLLEKNFPSNPVTNGKRDGYIEFSMDDGSKLFAKLDNEAKARIYYETNDGFEVATTADLLKKLGGDAHKFSIDAFLTMQPKPRRELLQKIVGIDLDELNDREKLLEDNRRLLKVQLKEQQGRIEPYDHNLIGITEFEDPDKYQHQKTEMLIFNEKYKDAEKAVDQMRTEIEELTLKLKTLTDRMKKGEDYLNHHSPFTPEQIEETETKYQEAKSLVNEVNKAQRLHKEFTRAEELEGKVKEFDKKILDVRRNKTELITANPLPADGLEFNEDGVLTLNGLPFEENQISTSSKVIAGLQIAESMLGKIKYIHFDASILDKNSSRKVLKWAESKGLQLCLERAVWEGGPLTVELVDESMTLEPAEA